MLRWFGATIKIALFALVILVLGNWIRWNGRTLSDQVKIGMSHAERSNIVDQAKDWAGSVSRDVKTGFERKSGQPSQKGAAEELTSSERQKLKALIRELNGNR